MGGIQLLATIKNGFKFFQRKMLMRNTVIAEEELTHKVFAGLKNNFAVSGLRRPLDVLLDKGDDALAAISAIADLDWVVMVAEVNARTLSGVTAVDIKIFGVARGNAGGRLLTDSAHKSGAQREGTTNGKGFLGEAVKISIIDGRDAMSTLEVIATGILALEVANTRRGAKSKAHVIGDIGGLGFGPNMAVVAFVHALHGFGLRMRGR